MGRGCPPNALTLALAGAATSPSSFRTIPARLTLVVIRCDAGAVTINGCEFDLECPGEPAAARDAAVGYLVKIGYVLKERSEPSVHLKFEGSWFAKSPEKHTHHVHVAPRAGALHFEFTTGIVASYWTEKDVQFAKGRADAAIRAVRAFAEGPGDYRGADEEPMIACRYCGKINPETAACSCCGAAARS